MEDHADVVTATPEAPAGWFGRTFHSMKVRNFRLFIVGQLLSTTGTWMQAVAAPWLVLKLTNSGVSLGIDTALTFLPTLLFGAWGGVVADRYDNRRVQIVTQVLYAASAMLLFVLVATKVVELWMVYSISFLTGCITAVDMPTRQSFYLEMVGRGDLTNAMSLNTATFTGTRILGPVIAGLMIRSFDVAPVFLTNAISYLAVVLALLAMRVGDLHPRPLVARGKGQIRAGIRYVWRTPALRLSMTVMLFVFLFAFNFAVLMPLLAVRTFHGDARTYGDVLALFGAGSLVAALAMASRTKEPNPRRLSMLAIALGVLSVAVALSGRLLFAAPILPFLGAAGTAFAITGNSTLQLTASSEMRGRVMALYTVIFLGSTPFGGTLAGWVGEHLHAETGLAGGGVIAVIAGVVALTVLARQRVLEPSAPGGSSSGD